MILIDMNFQNTQIQIANFILFITLCICVFHIYVQINGNMYLNIIKKCIYIANK